jgi:hypothetical protein
MLWLQANITIKSCCLDVCLNLGRVWHSVLTIPFDKFPGFAHPVSLPQGAAHTPWTGPGPPPCPLWPYIHSASHTPLCTIIHLAQLNLPYLCFDGHERGTTCNVRVWTANDCVIVLYNIEHTYTMRICIPRQAR